MGRHTKIVIPSEYSTKIRRNLKNRAASRERPTTGRVSGGFAFCAMLTEVHDDAGKVDQRRYVMLTHLTRMVGISRSGITSKRIRDNSQACGLVLQQRTQVLTHE